MGREEQGRGEKGREGREGRERRERKLGEVVIRESTDQNEKTWGLSLCD